jgi:ATP synthase protein I
MSNALPIIPSPTVDPDAPSPLFRALRTSSVGLEMAVAIGIGWGVGYAIDRRWDTDPWGMLIGLGFGIAAGFRGLWRAAQLARRETLGPDAASNRTKP